MSEKIVKVAWVSRHPPLKSQLRELQRVLHAPVDVRPVEKTFRDAREIIRDVRSELADVAVVVAPLSMIAVLLREAPEIAWLRAEMTALHECNVMQCQEFNPDTDVWLPMQGSDQGRHMRFSHFCRIREVRVICEPMK